MVNDVRRVYTDGRSHTPEDDAYPSWNGDTVGFWDGDVLVTHTKYLMNGQYQRGVQPNYSDKTETVERWHKVDVKTLQADVWVFDPVNLAKPVDARAEPDTADQRRQTAAYQVLGSPRDSNNDIVRQDDGTSQFKDFTFVPSDAPAGNKSKAAKTK